MSCPIGNGNVSFNIKSNPCCPPTNVCAPLRKPCVPCIPCAPIKVCAPLRKPCLPCAPCLQVCAPMDEPCAACPPGIPCPTICPPMNELCPPCRPCEPSECCYQPKRPLVKGCKCPNMDGSCKRMMPRSQISHGNCSDRKTKPWWHWQCRPLITSTSAPDLHFTWNLKRKIPDIPDIHNQELVDVCGYRTF